jgi:hypothetical protein
MSRFSLPEEFLLDIVVIGEREIGEINRGLAYFFHPEEHPSKQSTKTHVLYPTRSPAEFSDIPGIHHLQARGVTITASRDPQNATLDGEVRGQTPMQVQVAHKQLQVVVLTMAGVHSFT